MTRYDRLKFVAGFFAAGAWYYLIMVGPLYFYLYAFGDYVAYNKPLALIAIFASMYVLFVLFIALVCRIRIHMRMRKSAPFEWKGNNQFERGRYACAWAVGDKEKTNT